MTMAYRNEMTKEKRKKEKKKLAEISCQIVGFKRSELKGWKIETGPFEINPRVRKEESVD